MSDEVSLNLSPDQVIRPEASPARRTNARTVSIGFVLLLWLLAAAVNLLSARYVWGFNTIEPGSDEAGYMEFAQVLLKTHRFPSIYRTPVYPGALALIFSVTGPSVKAAKVFNCFFGGLTPVGIYILFRLLFPELRERKARIAGLVAALLPTLWSVNGTLYSETLSTAMFIWFNILLVSILRRLFPRDPADAPARQWPYWLGIGAAVGFLVFTKPQHVFFVPFLLLSAIWFFRRTPRRLASVLIASTLGFCLVLGPWWRHNWRETGGYFIPFTTSGDRTLVDANNPTIARLNRLNVVGGRTVWEGAGKFLFKIEENELIDMRKFDPMDEVHRARYCRSAALGWIKSHPGDWAVLCLKKLGYAIGVWPLHQGSHSITLLNIAFGILLILSIPGWRYLIRQPGWHRLLLLQIATFLSLTIVFFGSWRYRNPFEGSVIIAAVLGAAILFPRAKVLDPEEKSGFDVIVAP